MGHFLSQSCYLQSWTVYANCQGLVLWGLTCFTSTRAEWAVITEQNCRDTHGLGPRRVAVLWVRCGRTPSSRRPEQQQTPQFVGQRVTWSNLPCFKTIQFICLIRGAPERWLQSDKPVERDINDELEVGQEDRLWSLVMSGKAGKHSVRHHPNQLRNFLLGNCTLQYTVCAYKAYLNDSELNTKQCFM